MGEHDVAFLPGRTTTDHRRLDGIGENMTGRTHNRRTVLTTTGAAVAGAALGGTALAACAGGASQNAAQSQPNVTKGAELATLDRIPVGSTISVPSPDNQDVNIIVSRPAEDEVVAFLAVCTHQGCAVLAEQSRLRCPCHNSTFDPFTGDAQGGPAYGPLPRIDVTIDGERVVTA